jgi:hypothetical protein
MSENDKNFKNASFIHKGGKSFIQDDGQKGTESTYLALFLRTKLGEEWYDKNKITKKISGERPDFIFETSIGKTIGLEIVNLVIKTERHHATATLRTVASQVCQYFKKEKGIALSISIDIYDEREFSANFQDRLNRCYDPGFKHLEVPNNVIKNAIIAEISKEDVPAWGVSKKWVELPPHKFIITVDRFHEPYTYAHVNNSGIAREDPFEELQDVINSKNKKYKIYTEKCDECDLLVVSDDSSTGNFAFFSDKINKYKFVSAFKNVYLLDFGSISDIKTTKLKNKHRLTKLVKNIILMFKGILYENKQNISQR